jgi:Zn-dependent protease with chaperone function
MTIRLTCHACQTAFEVKDAFAGKRGPCPRCRTLLEVPALAAAASLAAAVAPAPKVGSAADSSAALMREILAAFQGEFPPARRAPGYRLGIVLVAAAMVLLPVFYVALVGAVIALVAWHATANVVIIQRIPNVWSLLFLYVGPLIAGTILVIFLLKPLFARPGRHEKCRRLRFGDEPVLFAFVARIARAVNAPEPKRIEVSCEVNASAARDGRELVLMIGLPLVAGLSVEELAGTVAHELGHFSQGAGMRLIALICRINGWFERAVNERDGWDEVLIDWCADSGRLAPIFYLARLGIGVTRGILWLFLLLAHALCCFLLRQMEYDADRYAARLSGSQIYENSFRRVFHLDLAAHGAHGLVLQGLPAGDLPEDLPSLIADLTGQIRKKDRLKIEKMLWEQNTSLFSTHPAYKARLKSVRAENSAGIFHLDRPATVLFRDFPKLARSVTRDVYRRAFGKVV